MNRKYVLGAALTVAIAVSATIGADLASAAPSPQPAATVAQADLGDSHYLPLALARKAADVALAA